MIAARRVRFSVFVAASEHRTVMAMPLEATSVASGARAFEISADFATVDTVA